MAEVRVELGERSYSVFVENGVTQRAPELLQRDGLFGLPFFVVTDENVERNQAPLIEKLRLSSGGRSVVQAIPAGESSKSLSMFCQLLDKLAEFENGEGVLIAAVGGGVVGDLTGFAAACYKRGVPWIQVPTTLLSQVDASVGGKCAVNHPLAKNLIGAFHQPALVLADTEALTTLPDRELRSGLAEVIKHGVIADAALFSRIEKTIEDALALDPAVLEDYVATSCSIKAAVVAADERDVSGKRASLNYGHTFGHAIELAARFSYSHGEAISIGMACAGDLGVRMRWWDEAEAIRVENVIKRAGLPVRAENVGTEEVMAAMKLDKKFRAGTNQFVVARKIGWVELERNIPEPLIREVVERRLSVEQRTDRRSGSSAAPP